MKGKKRNVLLIYKSFGNDFINFFNFFDNKCILRKKLVKWCAVLKQF